MEKLARKQIQQLTPYLSARRIGGSGDVWLNANESPFSNLYQANNLYQENNEYQINFDNLNRYSSCQPQSLIEAYAAYAEVEADQVLTSRGADEGIELLIRAFCEPREDAIIYCPPTYGMYAISAETIGVECKVVPTKADWQLDLEAIKANLDNVKLVFVCSPNNPTGNLIKRQDIIALLEMTKERAIVVIDEAYIDFCPEASTKDLLAKYNNLAILRTMSKAFALAGLRCGFTLANKSLIDVLLKVIAPYPVPVPVSEIACAALSESGLIRTKSQVEQLNNNRAFLTQELSKLKGVIVYPGWGNYLLVHFPNGDQIFKSAWDNGIILRNSPIENAIRISVGNMEECKKVVNFMKGIVI